MSEGLRSRTEEVAYKTTASEPCLPKRHRYDRCYFCDDQQHCDNSNKPKEPNQHSRFGIVLVINVSASRYLRLLDDLDKNSLNMRIHDRSHLRITNPRFVKVCFLHVGVSKFAVHINFEHSAISNTFLFNNDGDIQGPRSTIS